MKVVLFASGEFSLPTFQWLVYQGHEIPLVITQPPRPAGRGKKLAATPISVVARARGLIVEEPENVNEAGVIAFLRRQEAQLGLVIAYGQKLGAEVLSTFPAGCINLHASLLPKYRGAAPINWAILQGEEKSGCTVFRLVERMDAGPVLSSRWTWIKPEEIAGELHDRLAAIGVDAVDAALSQFADGRIPEGTPQDESNATRAPKLDKKAGYVRFDQPAAAVARHICGMTPWPGAMSRFHSLDGRWEFVSLSRARAAEHPRKASEAPGTLDPRLYAATSEGYLELLEVKPASGRLMSWRDYVNGRHVHPGDRFAPVEE